MADIHVETLTEVEQTAHYCKRYAVFCTGANERGECKTTACWNTSQWLNELLRRGGKQ